MAQIDPNATLEQVWDEGQHVVVALDDLLRVFADRLGAARELCAESFSDAGGFTLSRSLAELGEKDV